MPCGGIFHGHAVNDPCWVCRKRDCDLWCIEWDAVIHSECVPAFLASEEGQIVLSHGHEVIIMKDGKPFTLHEGT